MISAPLAKICLADVRDVPFGTSTETESPIFNQRAVFAAFASVSGITVTVSPVFA
jgi:hypothetical protein